MKRESGGMIKRISGIKKIGASAVRSSVSVPRGMLSRTSRIVNVR